MVEDKITGLMIYYYHVCKRKLWLSNKGISMESDNEDVSVGKFVDENTYSRERKHIMINNEINIDFIKNKGSIHEVKKSRRIEEASIWQVKYYLYYLENNGVDNIDAKIDYPLLRETVDVNLNDIDREEIKKNIKSIINIISSDEMPKDIDSGICKKCAYYDLCKI